MLQFVATIAHTALAADVSLFKIINAHHTPFLDGFFTCVSYLGNGWIIIPLFLAFAVWCTPKNRRSRTIIFTTVVLLISGLSNSAVKELADRRRPSAYFVSPEINQQVEKRRSYEVHVVQDKLYKHSFPSGHAGTAFTLAALLVLIFGTQFWPAFLVAAFVGYSRVYMGVHFPFDILVGGFMGSGITFAVWYGLAKIAPRRQET
jgi:undecaprenyl-diphosphatase